MLPAAKLPLMETTTRTQPITEESTFGEEVGVKTTLRSWPSPLAFKALSLRQGPAYCAFFNGDDGRQHRDINIHNIKSMVMEDVGTTQSLVIRHADGSKTTINFYH